MRRWVWQHSIKDASFTSWAAGAPAVGENFQDCALMALEVCLPWVDFEQKRIFLELRYFSKVDFLWLDKDCLETQAGVICQRGA